MANHDESGREKYEHKKLTKEEDEEQRGEDPKSVRHDPKPQEPQPDPEKERERKKTRAFIDHWRKEKGRVRQDGLWPYLLIRAVPGDHGVRPLTVPFWESPDILVVPGIVQNYDGVSATLSPQAGVPHTIFVHVWNLGRLPAIGIKLRVYWANPSFSFDDPAHPPQIISSIGLNLPDRQNPNCHQLIRLPAPWIPVIENGGHECLLAKVDCFADGGGQGFNANTNRHVGQRNLKLVNNGVNLAPILASLERNLPFDADLQLLHGMRDLHGTLLVHEPRLLATTLSPANLPQLAYALQDGSGHLGSMIRGSATVDRFVPPSVVGPVFQAGRIESSLINHDQVQEMRKSQRPIRRLMDTLGVRELTSDELLKNLGARRDEGHLLRLQATQNGKVIGGYTLIVRAAEDDKKEVEYKQAKQKARVKA